MVCRGSLFALVAAIALLIAGLAVPAVAQTPGAGGTTTAPSAPEVGATPAPPPAPPGLPPVPTGPPPALRATPSAHKPKRRPVSAQSEPEVEPGRAEVKILEDTWVYSRPSKISKHLRRIYADKLINVTGSTHYFLQVQLKDGTSGYILPSTVGLIKPTDKIFKLTLDSPVYDHPNRWGKKIAQVHKGRPVHVIGLALEYMKIRMKNGTEGYIPSVALE